MCASCKAQDQMTIYDIKCFICGLPNQYYEKFRENNENLWFCPNKECISPNLLPAVECRNCFQNCEQAFTILKNNSYKKDFKL